MIPCCRAGEEPPSGEDASAGLEGKQTNQLPPNNADVLQKPPFSGFFGERMHAGSGQTATEQVPASPSGVAAPLPPTDLC